MQPDATLKPSLLTKLCPACGQTYQPISDDTTPRHACPAAAPDAPATQLEFDDALLGSTLAERYVIEQVLDKGGMGVVYVARHTVLAHRVAVKVMRQRQHADGLQRFVREAQLLSRLRHPNIVYVQDFGLLPGGMPYLVMELLPGKPLSALLKQGPVAAERACRLAQQVARGISAVHEAGIIHRDLKPENIILTEDRSTGDIVKIIDFGIAKEVGSAESQEARGREAPITRVGAFLGSPRYTAPEQAKGHGVDGRSDQYSLGCILYHMLVGAPPFDSEYAVDILQLHITKSPPPPRQRRPDLKISATLEALVLRTLAKRQEDRFPSMAALAQALGEELAPLARPAWRGRLLFPLLALSAVMLGLGSFIGYHVFSTPRPLTAEEIDQHRAQAIEALLSLIQASDATVQAGAARALGQSGEKSVQPRILSALRSTDALVRRSAVEALGQLGDPKTVAELHPLLDAEGTAQLKVAAAQAIDNLGDPRGLMFLEKSLRSADAGLSRATALALCARRGQSVRAALVQLLGKKSIAETDDLPSLTCLARIGDDAARGRLRTLFEQSAHTEARLLVAVRLLELGEPSGQTFLRGLLRQPGAQQLVAARLLAAPTEPDTAVLFRRTLEDSRTRGPAQLLAAEGLGKSGQLEDLRRLRPLILPAIENTSRVAAAQSMLQLIANDPAALSQQSLLWTRSALVGDSPIMRQTAVDVLAEDTTHDVVPVLVEMAKDLSPEVRRRAVRALGIRASRAAMGTLRQGLLDSDLEVRTESIHALHKAVRVITATPEEALKELHEALKPIIDSGTRVEQAVARSQLLKLGDTSQLPALAALRDDQAPTVRLTVVRENSTLPELMRGYLKDGDWEVRFAAARSLAEFGAEEAIPILKEALERGGPDSLVAYHGLLGLKAAVSKVPNPDAWLNSDDASLRIRAVESAAELPAEIAVGLLERASHDREPLVRLMVVAVVGEKTTDANRSQMSAILQLLISDENSAVRMRARALYGRFLLVSAQQPAKSEREKAEPKLVPLDQEILVAVKANHEAAQAAAQIEPPSVEKTTMRPVTVSVVAPSAVWFRVDRRAWQLSAKATLSLAPGRHTITTIDKAQTLDLVEGKEVPAVTLEASTLEQLVKSGMHALDSNDLRKGQRALERVQSMCARDRKIDQPCGTLSGELSLRLAAVYEEQGRFADAMKELQRLGAAGKGTRVSPEQQAAILTAIGRLGARLGQVILISKVAATGKNKNGCEEKVLWLPPGSHSVNHAGKTVNIQVRAKETVRVGACD